MGQLDSHATVREDLGMELDQLRLLAAANERARNGTARQIRKRAGVTLAEMAAAVGDVSESAVCRWETGSRHPRGKAAIRWAIILNELERASTPAAA